MIVAAPIAIPNYYYDAKGDDFLPIFSGHAGDVIDGGRIPGLCPGVHFRREGSSLDLPILFKAAAVSDWNIVGVSDMNAYIVEIEAA